MNIKEMRELIDKNVITIATFENINRGLEGAIYHKENDPFGLKPNYPEELIEIAEEMAEKICSPVREIITNATEEIMNDPEKRDIILKLIAMSYFKL